MPIIPKLYSSTELKTPPPLALLQSLSVRQRQIKHQKYYIPDHWKSFLFYVFTKSPKQTKKKRKEKKKIRERNEGPCP